MALTKDDLASALHELGTMAVAEGKVIDLAVYGGSALMLVSNFRGSSWDMDAVAQSGQDFVDRAARTIAQQRSWPSDWLNDGVRTYLSPLADHDRSHELFASYPDEISPGLRVYVPTAEYLLAMKLMALRVETANDFDDIINLMRVVGVTSQEQIVELAAAFYPEARISGKLRLSLGDLWRAYRDKLKQSDHEPPRYLGRSGPPAED
jgi:hypothetical protein